MYLWRISNYADLSGFGAELDDGRWHTASPGKRLLYLAEHPAVALVENLVSLDGDSAFFPDYFQLLRIVMTKSLVAEKLKPKQLDRIDSQDFNSTRTIGDAWLSSASSALLRVPSIPSPESWNYLFNPLHRDAAKLKLDWARRIAYDKRLFRLDGV